MQFECILDALRNSEVKGVFLQTVKVPDSSHFSSLGELTALTDGTAVSQTRINIP